MFSQVTVTKEGEERYSKLPSIVTVDPVFYAKVLSVYHAHDGLLTPEMVEEYITTNKSTINGYRDNPGMLWDFDGLYPSIPS